MTTFLDPRQHDALVLIGSVHGLTAQQLSYGLRMEPADTAAVVTALHQLGWTEEKTASKCQRERYGTHTTAIHLSSNGRQIWRQLLAREQTQREQVWKGRSRRAA